MSKNLHNNLESFYLLYDLQILGPRFVNHTKDKNSPSYYEDFWTWNLIPEFKDFVFNSPTPKIASELLDAKRVNLVMDNWFYREAGLLLDKTNYP